MIKSLILPHKDSIVRRSVMLLGMTVPAMAFNLALIYLATFYLEAERFGIFYLGISLVNILFAPSYILTIFFSRFFVTLIHKADEETTVEAIYLFVRLVLTWGGFFSVLVFFVLIMVGNLVGATSIGIILFVVLIDYTSYLANTARCAYQGRLQFFKLGLYTLVWMGLRLALGFAGMIIFGTAQGALAGIALSGLLVFAGFYSRLRKERAAAPVGGLRLPPLADIFPVTLSYALFIAIVNLDILVSYLILDKTGLGIYAASSALPKAILVATLPVMQVAFPVMVGQHSTRRVSPLSIAKGLLVTIGAASAAAILISNGSSYVCGGEYGLRACDGDIMDMLLVAAVSLCVVRMLVLLQFARGRDWQPLLLLVPVAVFIFEVAGGDVSLHGLALAFEWLCIGLLLFFAVCCFLPDVQGMVQNGRNRLMASIRRR